jgi:3-hydroxyisobutyrate dehydrogenase-like beta-hydroxyacid dehydrogenase
MDTFPPFAVGASSTIGLPEQAKIGFVGLGRMGTAIAANFAAVGREVIAYVRTPGRTSELAALGLRPTTDSADLFDCDVVVSMLPDDDSVLDASFGRTGPGGEGFALGLRRGAIHLSMSTIGTATASHLTREHARHGQGFVAAPVFGNPDAAKARRLFVVMAGAPADVERCRVLVGDLAQQTFIVGADPGHANLIKLLGNMMMATALEMRGDSIALVRKRGLDPKHSAQIVGGTMVGGRAGPLDDSEWYAAGLALPPAFKGVRGALAEAAAAAVPMPSVNAVRDRLIAGITRGNAVLDWTALSLIATREARIKAALLPARRKLS